ncbi:MYO2 [Symbiodinium pilosum]|uniref:MYO2 protein n=1 Tax=Symbiodinium pilosum TaxID=2952 RepID=A0A812WTC3_SYMPI|nr:MYO2 [Symbiodinium pilosum]
MGVALATHCCASDEEEKPEALKSLKKDVAFVSVSLDKQPLTESLQGNWYRQCDSKHVGEISGSRLFWNPQWGLNDVSSPLSEGSSGLLVVQMEDETRYATVTTKPQTSIMWADGDVWIRT